MNFLDISRNLGFNTRFKLLPAMSVNHTDIAWSRPAKYRYAVLGPIHNTVAPRPWDDELVYKIADRFSTRYAGYRGENDCHVEFDATENIRVDHWSSDVWGIRFEHEKYAGEADNRNTRNDVFSPWFRRTAR